MSHTADVGGAPTSLLLLLEHGLAAHARTTVLFGADGPMVERFRAVGVEVVQVDRTLSPLRRLSAVAWVVAGDRPDVVLANCAVPSSRDGGERRALGVGVVWIQRESPDSVRSRKLMPWMRRWPTSIVAVSQPIRDAYGDDGRVVYVPNGVDAGRFTPAVATGALRAELGIPDQARVVAFVGLLHASKGVDVLLDLVPDLLDSRPDVHVLLVGDGPLLPAAETLAGGALAGRLHVTGRRRRAGGVRAGGSRRAAVDRRGVSRVALEALACATPMVATDVGDTAVVVRDGVTGWCVAAGDPGAFADALAEALDLPAEQLAALGANGRPSCSISSRSSARRPP
ncbi:MAG: glycosyltransferase [Acidimicrobiales bacterium]